MKKVILLFFATIFFASSSLAAPLDPNFNEVIKSIVTFIYVETEDGKIVPNGTGFFISINDTPRDSPPFIYLVTAKHVIQKKDKSLFPKIFIRLYKLGGDMETVPLFITTEGNKKNVYLHEDSSVDLAVIPIPFQVNYRTSSLNVAWITTKDDFKKFNIREGTEVFFTGLFTPHIGEHKNYPIVRFGRVAMVTDEKVDWDHIKTDLYLIEATSTGGNSGSPVFFYIEEQKKPGLIMVSTNPIMKLAGIMKGFFGEQQQIQFIETVKVPVASSNLGIAAVIPAYKLHEILFSENLKKLRTLK
jgi:hypothetical protein